MNNLKKVFHNYQTKEWIKSELTSIIFLVPLLAILLIPTINLIFLYVPYMLYFFMFIFIMSTIIIVVSNKIYIETLQNYQVYEDINYQKVVLMNTVFLSSLILIGLTILFIILN